MLMRMLTSRRPMRKNAYESGRLASFMFGQVEAGSTLYYDLELFDSQPMKAIPCLTVF